MSDDLNDEQPEEPELEAAATDGEPEDADPEPDFELHGQFFDAGAA